jgi:hypothetical protein
MTNFQIGHSTTVMFDDAAISKVSTADESTAGLEKFVKGNSFDAEGFLIAQKNYDAPLELSASGTADASFEILSKAVFGSDWKSPVKTTVSDRFAATTAFRKRLHGALPEGAPAWLNSFLGGDESQARLEIRRALKTAFGK